MRRSTLGAMEIEELTALMPSRIQVWAADPNAMAGVWVRGLVLASA